MGRLVDWFYRHGKGEEDGEAEVEHEALVVVHIVH